jgi:hypothetical protein
MSFKVGPALLKQSKQRQTQTDRINVNLQLSAVLIDWVRLKRLTSSVMPVKVRIKTTRMAIRLSPCPDY